MSFDVFLQRFIDGEPAEVERESVRAALATVNCTGPCDNNFYLVTLADGVSVEFASGHASPEPFTGCSFVIRHFSPKLCELIFNIAVAGDMVIIPAMRGTQLILVAEQRRQHVPEHLHESLHSTLVTSPRQLADLLQGGIEGWSDYRDHVVDSQ